MNKDEIVTVRFTSDEKEFITKDAERMGIKTSTLIRLIVRDYIKDRQKEK